LPDAATVILDSGTTALALAKRLAGRWCRVLHGWLVGSPGSDRGPAGGGEPAASSRLRQGTGRLAKTDRIDAFLLAELGRALNPPLRPLKDEEVRELEGLLVRRRQIVEMLTMEKYRLQRATSRIRADIKAHVEWLQKRLKDVDRELREASSGPAS